LLANTRNKECATSWFIENAFLPSLCRNTMLANSHGVHNTTPGRKPLHCNVRRRRGGTTSSYLLLTVAPGKIQHDPLTLLPLLRPPSHPRSNPHRNCPLRAGNLSQQSYEPSFYAAVDDFRALHAQTQGATRERAGGLLTNNFARESFCETKFASRENGDNASLPRI